MNKTIKLLMLSDIFVLTGFGLIDPILAIFIKDNLIGGTIFSAGLASMIFFLTKSIIQLPFSRHIDKTENKTRWLILGTLLITLVPFIYIFSSGIKMIYLAQLIHGIGSGLAYPTWLGLWSINLDRKQESFEWSLYSTLTGVGIATTAAVGGALAQFIGFKFTFALVGFMSLVGCLILLWLNENNKKNSLSLLNEKITKKTGRDKEFLER